VAAQSRKLLRLGYLAPAKIPHLIEAFKRGLADLGYVEGQNLEIEYRFADGRPEMLAELAAELVRLRPDIIVTVATPATLAAKNATTIIPIVVATAGDLVRPGIADSLSRPGGNVTGTTLYGFELSLKRLEILKEAVPGTRRVAILGNAENSYNQQLWEDTQPASGTLGLDLFAIMMSGPGELSTAFAKIAEDHADAVIVLSDATFNSVRREIAQLAAEKRVPAMYEAREFVEAGGLMSYGPNIADMSYRAAAYVDKIIKGAKPADLPIEQPSTFQFHLNLKTAKALGLTIPPQLLARADEVIE